MDLGLDWDIYWLLNIRYGSTSILRPVLGGTGWSFISERLQFK